MTLPKDISVVIERLDHIALLVERLAKARELSEQHELADQLQREIANAKATLNDEIADKTSKASGRP